MGELKSNRWRAKRLVDLVSRNDRTVLVRLLKV